MADNIEDFRIQVPQQVLDDLQLRLKLTRLPDQLNDAGWHYGTELGYLRELLDYWQNRFDWRKAEDGLNRFNHYRTEVDGIRLHFIHQRSKHENALPLVLSHGWPGSIYEFHKIIAPLTDPQSHGGSADDAFHVVCPSIPGYGFSQAPTRPGFDVIAVAKTFAGLMARLGYDRYGAQGGDWGATISMWMGHLFPAHAVGIHLNMVPVFLPKKDTKVTLSEADKARLALLRKRLAGEMAYFDQQSTRPQTLGYGLNDSPAGLAAWILEKFRAWSDCEGDVENCFSKDDLLTNIMIYWATGSITSSMRLYYETEHTRLRAIAAGTIDKANTPDVAVPTGCALFPQELTQPPRSWAEQYFNITRWTEMPKGGHFAALEQPERLVDEIRAFFRPLRKP